MKQLDLSTLEIPATMLQFFVAALITIATCSPAFAQSAVPTAQWPNYGNDPGGQRYSPLNQINQQNVGQLKLAWTYHTGDVSDGTHAKRKSAFENTPIVIDGTMYISTPFSRVVALDPETGKMKWWFQHAPGESLDLDEVFERVLIDHGEQKTLMTIGKAGGSAPLAITCSGRILCVAVSK